MSPQYILLRAKSVNKIPFTNEKIKFSKRVFGQAFSKKLVEFEAKPQGFKVFMFTSVFLKGFGETFHK